MSGKKFKNPESRILCSVLTSQSMSLLAQVCCLVPKEHLPWIEECYLHCRQKILQLARHGKGREVDFIYLKAIASYA